jgi:hypothetical protein
MDNNDIGATGPQGAAYTQDLVQLLEELAKRQLSQEDADTISQACSALGELQAALKTTRATIRIMDEGKQHRDDRIASLEASADKNTLLVKLASMSESNGCVTWDVLLAKTADAAPWDCLAVYSDTIKGRAEYEADRLKHFLGQGPEPDILDYDTDAPAVTQQSDDVESDIKLILHDVARRGYVNPDDVTSIVGFFNTSTAANSELVAAHPELLAAAESVRSAKATMDSIRAKDHGSSAHIGAANRYQQTVAKLINAATSLDSTANKMS